MRFLVYGLPILFCLSFIPSAYSLNLGTLKSAVNQDGVGNGGDVLDCSDGVYLLDLYEGETYHQFNLELQETHSDPVELLRARLSSWEPLAPEFFGRLLSALDDFMDNSRFLPQIILRDIPDSDHIGIPNNCEIKQIAVQKEVELPNEKTFTISLDLWNQMPTSHQAGLLLHEIIYQWAIKDGHPNSIRTRYMTGYLFSDRLNSGDSLELFQVLRHLLIRVGMELELYGADSYCQISAWDPYANEEGRCYPAEAGTFITAGAGYTIPFTQQSLLFFTEPKHLNKLYPGSNQTVVIESQPIEVSQFAFHPNRYLALINANDAFSGIGPNGCHHTLNGTIKWDNAGRLYSSYGGQPLACLPSLCRTGTGSSGGFEPQSILPYGGTIKFYPDGVVAETSSYSPMTVCAGLQEVQARNFTSFYPGTGFLRDTTAAADMTLFGAGGTTVDVREGSRIRFDASGYVIWPN